MPNEMDQRRIFWLLKRGSSVTYWNQVHDTQQAFLNAIESVVKDMSKNDPGPKEIDIYKRSLDDVINLEEGLRRLTTGDRSVFHTHSQGCFSRIGDGFGHLLDLLRQNGCMEYPDVYITDGAKLLALANAASSALFWGVGTFERMRGNSAAWYATYLLLPQNLPKHAFPDPLPEVPKAPEPVVLVKTGEEVPVDGIYEPEQDGTCMNYLLAGTTAPTVDQEKGEPVWPLYPVDGKVEFLPSIDVLPTTWRLIWEDRRYLDGTVPDEEKDYFLPLPKQAAETTAAPRETARALPGETCTKPGYWWTPAKQPSRRRFERDEVFQDFPDSDYGETIWYLDREEN